MHDPKRISLHATLVLALIAACGDDDDGTLADTGATAAADSTSAAVSSSTTDVADSADADSADASTSVDDASTSVDDGSSSAGSTTGVPNACDTPPPATDPCLTCGWEQCADPYVACCELSEFGDDGTASSGCLPVVACALATGCEHASCYEPDTCMAEIDGAGGISGDGTAAAGAFGECLGAAVVAGASDACAQCQAAGG